MSLISLLIALAAERYLSSPTWQFKTYYQSYFALIKKMNLLPSFALFSGGLFILAPVAVCYFLLELVDDGLLSLILSTLVLIVCFGCLQTRDTYKKYLMAAFQGEPTTCELYQTQLQQDKNSPELSFGPLLIWLNYRYFIAVMFFFVAFGAPGALFYRLLVTVCEHGAHKGSEDTSQDASIDKTSEQLADEETVNKTEDISAHLDVKISEQLLFWLDWLPVRLVALGYMLVGHFSRAMPIWLESFFDVSKQPHRILVSVAQKSEDFMIDPRDCTAEPCLLVRLAKRTLLLCLVVIALLIITGVLN